MSLVNNGSNSSGLFAVDSSSANNHQLCQFDPLDTILNDITETVEALAHSYPMETPVITQNPQAAPGLSTIDWGFGGDELTFYDDNSTVGSLKAFGAAFYPTKLEASTQCQSLDSPQYTYVVKNEPEEVSVYSIKQECPSPCEPTPVASDYTDTMDQLRREIDHTCAVLKIPQGSY